MDWTEYIGVQLTLPSKAVAYSLITLLEAADASFGTKTPPIARELEIQVDPSMMAAKLYIGDSLLDRDNSIHGDGIRYGKVLTASDATLNRTVAANVPVGLRYVQSDTDNCKINVEVSL